MDDLLELSAASHHHLCPKQVLGVRMGMLAAKILDMPLPQTDRKRLFVFAETDGCAISGITASTGCSVNKRTMRLMDFGKVAATFVDTVTDRAIRIHPLPESRQNAIAIAEAYMRPEPIESRWHAYLYGYQVLDDRLLFSVRSVNLSVYLKDIISTPTAFAVCDHCGEEINNGREIITDTLTLCQACGGNGYYQEAESLEW